METGILHLLVKIRKISLANLGAIIIYYGFCYYCYNFVSILYTTLLQVQGYPTIKMFPAGSKESGPEEYDGGRTSSDIVRWVDEKLAENLPAPEVVQVLSYCYNN